MNPNAVKAHKIIVMGGGNYNNITIILARGSSCQGHSGTGSSFLTSVLSCAALWWHTFISFVSLSLSQPHTHCLVGLGPQSEHSKRSCFCSQTALGHDVHPLIAKLLRAWALCHVAAVGVSCPDFVFLSLIELSLFVAVSTTLVRRLGRISFRLALRTLMAWTYWALSGLR